MTLTAPTRQVLDPAGILGNYPTTVAITLIAFAAGAASSVGTFLAGASVGFAALALALFGAGCAIVIVSAAPVRAPFTARGHFLMHVFALCALGSSTAATWGSGGSFVEQNWVAVGLGILMIGVGPYRPVRELLAAGTISALFVAVVTLIEVEMAMPPTPAFPPLPLAVASAAAILALCYGSATYSASTMRSLERSRERADAASGALADELREQVARSVQEDRATILSRDVIPFLTDLLERSEVTESDRRRAREIAGSVRTVMVEDADRSWLDAFLAPAAYSTHRTVQVTDGSHLATELSMRQRTALRALLVAIGEDPSAADLAITLTPSDAIGVGSMRIAVESPDATRARYAPFLAVMRLAFSSSSVDVDRSDLIVRFTFDRD